MLSTNNSEGQYKNIVPFLKQTMLDKKIKIYFTNDLHSNIPSSITWLETLMLIKKKDDNSIIIDLGDFIEGTPFYNLFKGIPEQKIINKIYDIIIPGNHGFNEVVKLKNNRNLNIINANIRYQNKIFFNPYCIIKKFKYKIGFIGIMSPEAFNAIEVTKRNKYIVDNPINTLQNIIPKLKKQVDYLILLSHSGIEYDKKISKLFRGLDLILSSHCHSNFKFGIYNKIPILKAAELGNGYGQLIINNKKNIEYKLFKVSNRNKIFKIKEFCSFNYYIKKYNEIFSKKIFCVEKKFCLKYNNRKLLAFNFAEKIRKFYNSDICLINYYCLRDIFSQGTITLENIYKIIPFNNKLVSFKITKNKLDTILNNIDNEEKKSFCIDKRKNIKNINLKIITTSYILNNFFDKYNNIKYDNIISLKNFILKYYNFK